MIEPWPRALHLQPIAEASQAPEVVGLHDRTDLLLGREKQIAGVIDPGIVDQDIDRAPLKGRLGDRVRRRGVADVSRQTSRLEARGRARSPRSTHGRLMTIDRALVDEPAS